MTKVFATDSHISRTHFIQRYDKNVLSHPIDNLSDESLDQFFLGRSFFTIPWVEAPSATTARDGLGPLFSANTCISCHPRNGVGAKWGKNGRMSRAMVAKLSLPADIVEKGTNLAIDGSYPDPVYGGQISINTIHGVDFEAIPTVDYQDRVIRYSDGNKVTLQYPTPRLEKLNYGALHEKTIIVQRRAPALIGLGFLSKISDTEILANTDPDDKDGDGISGRVNNISQVSGQLKIGRFTTKASVQSVLEQVAAAASFDMGLTNPLFPNEQCTPSQIACQQAPRGRPAKQGENPIFDLPSARLSAITHFISSLKTPSPSPAKLQQQKAGQVLFAKIGCTKCHLPTMKTTEGIEVAPYSDLLLHDMGEGLADGRTEFSATGSEFRTAPLWGISTYRQTLNQSPHYLHDGRARSLEEAILWHGGEAENIKQAFMALSLTERNQLLNFLRIL